MTSEGWTSKGTVVMDGKTYYIREVLDSDCFESGTRYVSMDLVDANYEADEDE